MPIYTGEGYPMAIVGPRPMTPEETDLHNWYTATIWGKQTSCDNTLFEVMSLQVFQAGLTWRMILNKRDSFRLAFCNWDIKAVAGFDITKVEILCTNRGIIRNRLKIQAVVENAHIIAGIQAKYGSFCKWFYDILPGAEYPDLYMALRKTFRFMGPEISRMWLMASGRIAEHEGDKYRP